MKVTEKKDKGIISKKRGTKRNEYFWTKGAIRQLVIRQQGKRNQPAIV